MALVVDPFDQQFEDSGLITGGEGFPGLVELGQQTGDFGLVDLVGSHHREFDVDLGETVFAGSICSCSSAIREIRRFVVGRLAALSSSSLRALFWR